MDLISNIGSQTSFIPQKEMQITKLEEGFVVQTEAASKTSTRMFCFSGPALLHRYEAVKQSVSMPHFESQLIHFCWGYQLIAYKSNNECLIPWVLIPT